jgi:hypothetical protein
MHPSDYQACAIGSIPLNGILSALFLSLQGSIYSWVFAIVSIFVYLGAIYCSALAIKHTRQLIGKLAFSLLLAFYLSPFWLFIYYL